MEVATFMRAALRRWWIALLVALVAAGATYLVTRNTADSYDGAVVLTVPATEASTTGSNGQWVENFQTALTNSDVVKAVSKDTGASTGDLSAGLTASQVNNSSYIEVDYNSVDATRARAVVVSAAKRTAAYLSRSTVQDAQTLKTSTASALATATKNLTSSTEALSVFNAKNGSEDPNILLQAAQSQVTQLSVSRLQAQAQGKSLTAYDTAIGIARAAVKKNAPLASQFTSLNNRLHSAQLDAETAQSRASAASSALATAEQPPLIGTSTATLVKGQTTMLKAVAIAAGVGLILGIALALLVTALRRNKPTRRSRRKAAHQASSTSPADTAATDDASEDTTDDTADDAAGTDAAAGAQPGPSLEKRRRSPSPTTHDDEFEHV